MTFEENHLICLFILLNPCKSTENLFQHVTVNKEFKELPTCV